MTSSFRTLLPIVVLVAGSILVYLIFATKPEAKRRPTPSEAQISVEVMPIQPKAETITLQSYGVVQPRIKSTLVSQVSGKIDFIDGSFRAGGFFNKGQVLLRIEKADYEVEVEIAFANLADAKSHFQEQKALADQASLDWSRLNKKGEPSPLVLRIPQVTAAEARLKSAEANHKKAQLQLARTEIKAPFDGRVLRKNVDLGQVVGLNTPLGEIFAVDAFEIALPIKNRDLRFLQTEILAPQSLNGAPKPQAKVTLHSQLNNLDSWQANVERTAGAIDESNRQLSVIARVDEPYAKHHQARIPLKVGQYLTAKIQGKSLSDAIAIPNTAIYQGSYVYLYEDGVIRRQNISVAWQDEDRSIIEEGLKPGESLVTTPLGRLNSGTRVKLKGEEGTAPRRPGSRGKDSNTHGKPRKGPKND